MVLAVCQFGFLWVVFFPQSTCKISKYWCSSVSFGKWYGYLLSLDITQTVAESKDVFYIYIYTVEAASPPARARAMLKHRDKAVVLGCVSGCLLRLMERWLLKNRGVAENWHRIYRTRIKNTQKGALRCCSPRGKAGEACSKRILLEHPVKADERCRALELLG